MKGFYESLPGDDASDDATTDVTSNHDRIFSQISPSRTVILLVINCSLFIASCILLLTSWHWVHDFRQSVVSLSPYSPVTRHLPISSIQTEVRGTLFNDYSPPVVYRQDPSPEVDRAWETITQIEYFGVTAQDIRSIGKDPDTAVQIPSEWGLGSGLFLAELDGQHHLHCLNAIRQYAYFDYYWSHKYTNISTMPERHKAHLSHCLDILLQTLTCTPNLDIVPHVWMKTQKHPYPDFNIKRQCVAHEPILQWQKAVGIPDIFDKWPNYPRPATLKEVEAEASLLAIGEDLGS